MTAPKLTQSRLHAGVWDVVLTCDGPDIPGLTATCQGVSLPGLSCTKGDQPQTWYVRQPIPLQVMNDGLQTIVMSLADGTKIASLAILAGDVLADDLRAEIDLLRSELDMLKSAVRRLHVESHLDLPKS